MSNANGFKAQYKPHAGASWQTTITGTEHSCLMALQQLERKYQFVRVVNSEGRVVG